MNVIIVSDNLKRSVKIALPGTRFWIVLALAVAGLATVVHLLAVRLVEHWANTNDRRVLKAVELVRAKAEEDRKDLWRQAVDSLQQQISDIEVRMWWLNELGGNIADEIGVPSQKFFPGSKTPLLGGEQLRNISYSTVDRRAAISDMSDRVATAGRLSGAVARGYDSLRSYAGQRAMLQSTVPVERPVDGHSWYTSGYGYRKDPFTGRRTFHSGYDYGALRGTAIIAAAAGMVVYVGRLGNYGKTVEIYHGRGISTLYAHLSKYLVEAGSFVAKGGRIAIVGNTGRSTGTHLHYEVRVDGRPKPYGKTINRLLSERGLAGST